VKAMFANLTPGDFRGASQRERRAAERKRVHALFDVIQIAIHARDRAMVDDLMAGLAMATMAEVHAPGDTKSISLKLHFVGSSITPSLTPSRASQAARAAASMHGYLLAGI
jgi:hypothetical protein